MSNSSRAAAAAALLGKEDNVPDTIERPVYYEGQYLGAADLQVGLDYLRGQEARHLRTAHTWGILEGLGEHRLLRGRT